MKKTDTTIPNPLLRSQRMLHYWTQSQVAEKVGTTTVNVNRWESGATSPSLYFRQKLCELFQMNSEELGLVPGTHELPPEITSPVVFLASSYADAEKEPVMHLKMVLQNQGISLWSSRQVRKQGVENPKKALQEAIRASQAILLIVSPQARASRHVQEALQMAKIYKRQICAVWIEGNYWQECIPAGCDELHGLLDAREGYDYRLLDELIASLEPAPASTASQESIALTPEPDAAPDESPELPRAPSEPRNPYKGLRAFRPEDRDDFFGRDKLIAELATALEASLLAEQPYKQNARLLAVVGPSGSGKSSVVMAGLLPHLEAGRFPSSQQWVYLNPLVPGQHPMESLARVLAEYFPDKSLKTIREDLEDDSARGLHLLATSLVKRPEAKVVLVIDQFEELFTQTSSEEERQHFIDLLVASISEPSGPVIVLLTLRADFYDRPLHYPKLGRLIEDHHRIVLPMETQELRAAIERPAQLPDVQLTFEEELVGDLLYEVQGQVGALPLIQFTLDQLFQRRNGQQLTLQAYHELGGVKGALAQQAEETYAALHSDEHRRLARALFLRLIDPGVTEQDTTRRRAPLCELRLFNPKETTLIEQVATAFISARLLTTDTIAGTPTVEVSHEALIREWPRLADWLRSAREDIHLQQAISKDAAAWERRSKPRDRLYRGSQLVEARKWARRNTPSRSEAIFLQASVTYRIRYLLSVIAIFLLLVTTTGLTARLLLLLSSEAPNPTIVTTLNADGSGSLRYAIAKAKPGSTITFDRNLRGTIVLASTDLNIAHNLSIRGPGAGLITLSRGDSIHAIHVIDGVTVTISGLTFKSKGITVNPGISNRGTLTLVNCRFSGNGGINNARSGTLTITNSTVSDNIHSGIVNYGTLIITNSTIYSNTAIHRGGGITNFATLTLTDSTVSGNSTATDGGGISNGKGSSIELINSTISHNTATGNGGGLFNDIDSKIILTNSTVSGNTAKGDGGGIATVNGQATINFSTIYSNRANNGGGLSSKDASGKPSKVTITATIVAGNHTATTGGSDIAGHLTSYGYNLIQNFSGAIFVTPLEKHYTDISGEKVTDLKIDPLLRDNQGPTRTHALLPGSPAIDQIPPDVCQINSSFTDQRGMKRPGGKARKCDIGAYEYTG